MQLPTGLIFQKFERRLPPEIQNSRLLLLLRLVKEGALGRLPGWHREATSHPPSSPPTPLQERKQCRWRREINIPACSVPLQTFSKMSGLDHEIKPTQEKEALSGRKRGKRVAYLSILVSFLGGRAHGSDLAALLRWGCGKCTVILEELNQKMGTEWRKGCQGISILSTPGSRYPGHPTDSLIDPMALCTAPGPAARPLSLSAAPAGSHQRPFQIWAGAQNPGVETFLPPRRTAQALQYWNTSR